MRADRWQRGRLMGAGLASIAAHVVGSGLLLMGGGGESRSYNLSETLTEPHENAPPPRVRLGVERSRQMTLTWLGFEEPTPHAAEVSSVDQAALTPTPGEQAPAAEPDAAQAGAAESPAEVAQGRDPAEVAADFEAAVRPVIEQVRQVGLMALAAAQRAAEREAADREAAEAAARAEAEARVEAGDSGERSPSEADAASRERVVDVTPGRPAAAEGLQITTVRPNWSAVTRRYTRPGNPVVRIVFGRDGRVIEASITRSSGYSAVDGPLLDAIYSWTAQGEALEGLPENDPKAGVTINMRVLLR
jgi:TonB family protein